MCFLEIRINLNSLEKKIKLIRMINVYVNKCVCYYRFIYNYNNIILYVIYE